MLLEVQCDVSSVDLGSSAGVGPLYSLKSKVKPKSIYQKILEHFMLLSADKPHGDADFLFHQELVPAHSV